VVVVHLQLVLQQVVKEILAVTVVILMDTLFKMVAVVEAVLAPLVSVQPPQITQMVVQVAQVLTHIQLGQPQLVQE
jgi:hypothetical protein